MQSPYENGQLKFMEELDSKHQRWSTPSPTSFNYSFLTALPWYYGTVGPTDQFAELSPFDVDQRAVVRRVFDHISTIIPVTFTDTTNDGILGEITFAVGRE